MYKSEVIVNGNCVVCGKQLDCGRLFVCKECASAIALLKEQEPKPIAYTDNPYTGLPVARCPKCGNFARQFHASTDEETHYCPWCGQAVKWKHV